MSAFAERWAEMSGRDRGLAFGLVGVLLVVVILLVFLPSSDEPEPFTPPQGIGGTPTPAPTASASAVPETFDSFEGKDPFRPLVAAAGGGGDGGIPGPLPTSSGTPAPGPTGGPSGQRVTLLEITTQNGVRTATVEVNDRSYTVKEGDTFAGNYRVLDLTENCGTFVFGDERFTLCVGQEVLK